MLNIQKNFPLSKVTTLKIGGPAKEYIVVKSEEELLTAIKTGKKTGKEFLVIGGASNLLISDEGYDGLIIKNEVSGIMANTSGVKLDTHLGGEDKPKPSTHLRGEVVEVSVKAGTILQNLVDFANSHGLSGLQKLTGIPGTVGGAVYGNAAAYGQTISDYITLVKVLNLNNLTIQQYNNADCKFDYRDSGFKKNKYTILEIKFQFPNGNPDELKKESEEILQKRLKKYKPGILCPGSFFKNILMENLTSDQKKLIPKERDYYGKVPAWYFLDAVGAQGDQLGKIKIADFHGNLFMNLGGGTAKDFYALAKKYYKLVKQKFGIKLEPEVQLINLPPLT